MAFAITKSCCSDASCVTVCPVGCIHPAPGEPGFGTSEILHIDPRTCIDCGACADACPVSAIFPVDKLSAADRVYEAINAAYRLPPVSQSQSPQTRYPRLPKLPDGLELAVVGSGPAGMYTVRELLSRTDARITVLDALPTPGGLIRSGVAADHPETKGIQRLFDLALRHPRVRFVGGVRLGHDVTLDDLRRAFDAVFVATGARIPRHLGVPGEDLPGVVSALDVVRWAGGEPGADTDPILEAHPGAAAPGRAVIIGTGNVALDLVRLFTLPYERLRTTDVADRALRGLRERPLRDVIVLGRGPSSTAAYTTAEYKALAQVPGLEIRVIDADERAHQLDPSPTDHPRVTFVFGSTVRRFDAAFGGLHVTVDRPRTAELLEIKGRLAVTSIGHLPEPLDGIPEIDGKRVHVAGRVEERPGIYLVGWAKRGAVGGIGANRLCAVESVDSFLASFTDPSVTTHRATSTPAALLRQLRRSGVRIVDARGSTRIDSAELRAGRAVGRPRVKLTDLEALHRAARRRIDAR